MARPADGLPVVRGSAGRALDAGVRTMLEPRLAQDINLVRVHEDSRAVRAAQRLPAQPVTMGEDVHLGSGDHHPHSRSGLHRIAHAIARVVQHRRRGISADGEARAELAAATVATTVTAGLVQSSELRRLALERLDGVSVPLSFLADAQFPLPLPGTATRIAVDLRAPGPVPDDVLRATTVQFRTRTPGDLGLPAGTPDTGSTLTVDLAELSAGGAAAMSRRP